MNKYQISFVQFASRRTAKRLVFCSPLRFFAYLWIFSPMINENLINFNGNFFLSPAFNRPSCSFPLPQPQRPKTQNRRTKIAIKLSFVFNCRAKFISAFICRHIDVFDFSKRYQFACRSCMQNILITVLRFSSRLLFSFPLLRLALASELRDRLGNVPGTQVDENTILIRWLALIVHAQ